MDLIDPSPSIWSIIGISRKGNSIEESIMINLQSIQTFLIHHGVQYEIIDEEIQILENPDSPLFISEDGLGWNLSDGEIGGIRMRIQSQRDLNEVYQII